LSYGSKGRRGIYYAVEQSSGKQFRHREGQG